MMNQVCSKDPLLFNASIKISYLLPNERIVIMGILLEKDGPHIAIITIDNQKKLNAMSREMMQRLGNVWDELSQDETRCIILTGSGERAFCVGADISGDLDATPEISKVVNHALLKTDIFLSIGTSNNVYPAAGFIDFILQKKNNVELIEFNIEKTNKSSLFSRSIIGPASITVEEFVKNFSNQ